MSLDFNKINKIEVVEVCRNKKELLHEILGKLWRELK